MSAASHQGSHVQAQGETRPAIDASRYSGDDSMALIESMLSHLTFKEFNNEIAFSVGQEIRKNYFGLKANTGILISIRLFSGLTLFQAACGQDVNPTNEDWVRRKYNTVRDFGIPTLLKGRDLQRKGRDINSLGPEYAAHGGGYPIIISSVGPIGAIVVSGLTQETDHALIVESLHKFTEPDQ